MGSPHAGPACLAWIRRVFQRPLHTDGCLGGLPQSQTPLHRRVPIWAHRGPDQNGPAPPNKHLAWRGCVALCVPVPSCSSKPLATRQAAPSCSDPFPRHLSVGGAEGVCVGEGAARCNTPAAWHTAAPSLTRVACRCTPTSCAPQTDPHPHRPAVSLLRQVWPELPSDCPIRGRHSHGAYTVFCIKRWVLQTTPTSVNHAPSPP